MRFGEHAVYVTGANGEHQFFGMYESAAGGQRRIAGEEESAADKARAEKNAARVERAGQLMKEIDGRQDSNADNSSSGSLSRNILRDSQIFL